ncbi:AlkA N-terminal domain-containing protein [Micrococcus terreus]|uniref:AlkA N-terminal domain-containing protein n=1 Tax=Micrococcus terreus TaxID=574650 RepID=UPI003D748760
MNCHPAQTAWFTEQMPARTPLTVGLSAPHPYDAPGIFSFLAARAIAGVESTDLTDPCRLVYARTLALPHGTGSVEVTARRRGGGGAGRGGRAAPWTLTARVSAAPEDVEEAARRLRRLFDLDTDPHVVDSALSSDPHLTPSVHAHPGLRVPGAADAQELVIRALVGRQISVAAARTHLSRLAARLGSPCDSPFAGLSRIFPTSAQLAQLPPSPGRGESLDPDRPLRLPRAGVEAVRGAARALADGAIDLGTDEGAPPDAAALRARLLELPGIGPWTAGYISMRVARDPDAWLPGDVALVVGARALGILPAAQGRATARDHRALADHAERWSPWRSYAALHLWRAAGPPGAAPHTPPARLEP